MSDTATASAACAPTRCSVTFVEVFVQALAERDFDRLRSLLDPDVRLEALTPEGLETATGPVETARWFATRFDDGDVHETTLSEVFEVADRVGYHWRARRRRDADGAAMWWAVQESGFARVGGGGIEHLSLVDTGHRAQGSAEGGALQEFDTGQLGCTDGFPREYRTIMRSLPVGGRARIVTRDPSAKQDLPSLARMMGHRVLDVEEPGDERTIFTVERGR